MIGGVLKGVSHFPDFVRIGVSGVKGDAGRYLHKDIYRTNFKFRPGDSVWWQAGILLLCRGSEEIQFRIIRRDGNGSILSESYGKTTT